MTERHFLTEETKFKSIFAESPVGIALLGSEGRVEEMNRACMDIIGIREPNQIRKFSLLDSIFIPAAVKERMLNGESVRFETVCSFENAGIFDNSLICGPDAVYLDVHIAPLAIPGRGSRNYLVHVSDIGDRRQMETELKTNVERLQSALAASRMIGWDWEIAGDRITFYGNTSKILGMQTSDGFTSDAVFGCLHPEDRIIHLKKIQEAMAECSDYVSQFRWRRPDTGAVIWLEDRGRVNCDELNKKAVWMGGILMDITGPKQAGEELRMSREKLRALAANLESVREEERTKIAREIHDEFGQALTGLKMDLAWISKRLSEAELVEKAKAMQRAIDRTIRLVRKISTELRPGILDDFGLQAAMEWQLKQFRSRTGIEYAFESEIVEENIDPNVRTIVFRILQETLTNIIRHAGATRVDIRLAVSNRVLRMHVRDNGRGITEQEINNLNSLGILGMKERVTIQGGEFHVRGVAGRGTKISIRIPLNKVNYPGNPIAN